MPTQAKIDILDARLDKDYLILSYRVTNQGSQSIYLFTPMNDLTESGLVADPNKVYAYLDMDGVLQITKRVWSIPDDVDIYAPLMPNLTRVEAGQRFEERLAIPLPVIIDYPYRFAVEDELHLDYEAVMDKSDGLTLSIGYVAKVQSGIGLLHESGTTTESHTIEYGTARDGQSILQGPVMKAQIPVRDVDVKG